MSASCPGFRPHSVRATRCRRCFRDYSEHNPEQLGLAKGDADRNSKSETNASARVSLPLSKKKEEQSNESEAKTNATSGTVRKRVRNYAEDTASNSVPETNTTTSVASDRRRRPYSADMTEVDVGRRKRRDPEEQEPAAQRVQIITAKEVQKNELYLGDRDDIATSPDVEFILRVKTTVANAKDNDDDSVAATETTEMTEATLTGYQDTIDELQNSMKDLQNSVKDLKKKLDMSEQKCTKLEKEKKDIINQRKTSERDKEALEKTASEIMKLRAKINDLETKQEDIKDENKVLKLEKKELQQELHKREDPNKVKVHVNELTNKLQQAETLCEELMEENEEMKKEMKEMEEELEELHDNFREDQANEFFDLKKELETTAKNCRVLQFKLRKAERKCEQLEVEKTQLCEKNKDLHAIGKIDVDKARMKELECELSVAKEVSLKMHTEIEGLKENLKRSETEREVLRKQLAGEKFNGVPSVVEFPTITKDSVMGKDYEAVVRDLYDTMERETDLREQMRFSEDEIKTVRRKMSSLEQENETLVMQMKKLAGTKSKKAGEEVDDDDLTPEELKLQFELTEQEMCVLRKKVDEMEHENEGLQKEVKYLQDKLINQPLTTIELPDLSELTESEKTGTNIYMEQKMKLLEFEARELRRKLVEKERDNERLQTEVEVHRRKASKVIVRSRSLDSEFQVDLKRQLQLVEQEASILRQKTMDLESDNDKLQNENKRFQLRLSRKPPPGPAELMQLENMELKERTQDLERKLDTLKDELQKAAAGGVVPATVIQEYKPRREGATDTENQLIVTLKKTIKTKDDEAVALQTKMTQLEVDNTRLNREYKKLKDTLNHKRRPNRMLRETTTRMEMREIVKELEDEISDLQVTLRGREVVQEDLQENLDRIKKEQDGNQKEHKQQEDRMNAEISRLKNRSESLKEDITNEKNKSAVLQAQLEKLAGDQGMDINLLDSLHNLQSERKILTARIEELDTELKTEKTKAKELQDKLKSTSTLKEELSQGRKMLEEQKADMEREANKHKELLKKSEAQVKNYKKTMDEKEKALKTLEGKHKELQNELDTEKSRLKQHDNRQTEVAVGWLKEREELKRLLSELREKSEALQKEVESQEKQWKEKESKLREDLKKRQEKAVAEARHQMDADVKLAQNEEKSAKAKVTELTDQLNKFETNLKESQDKARQLNNQLRREREEWVSAQTSYETEVRAETKKRERLEKDHENQKRQIQEDLLKARDRIFQLEREHRKTQGKIDDMEGAHNEKVKQLEKEIELEHQEYDELTSKYEILEEEFLAVKQRLVKEKEQVQATLTSMRRNFEQANSELTSVRDTFNIKQDSWVKDKMDLNETIKELQVKVNRTGNLEHENHRLKDTIDEKESLIESYRKEEKHLKEERERLRRRVEDLTKRVSELERMERASRAMQSAGARSDREAQDLRIKLDHNETTHRGEIASLRADYEGRVQLMSHEMKIMQAQIIELSREKEELVVKIKETEVAMDEFKTNSLRRDRVRTREEVEKVRRRAETLESNLQDTLEKLEKAELEARNFKVQSETDRKAWQVQISELKSKINQYEEEKLLESSRGSTRGYAKTRLELAWDKERTEQQRLLADTQGMVNDLKDKVVTLETLKEKEKQESRRQINDLKALLDMEEQTTSRKVTELQADQSEVKESYVKLRNQYEILKREKERFDREREEWRQRLINTENVHGHVSDLMEEVQKMATLVTPEAPKTVNGDLPEADRMPKPPVRRASRANEELRVALEKIRKRTEELQKVSAPLSDAEIMKNPSFRRAISATDVNAPIRVRGSSFNDPGQRWMNPQRITNYPLAPPSMILRPPPRQKTLYRKSLSLDQQLASIDSVSKIWDSGDESLANTPYGSQLSLRTRLQGAFLGYESDSSVGGISMDSKASTLPRGSSYGLSVMSRPLMSSREGSVASSTEDIPVKVKTKKTLREKLKLTKKKKDTNATGEKESSSSALPGTELPPVKEEKERSIRSRISKALKKPLSRASSVDRAAGDRDGKETPDDQKSTLQKSEEKSSKRSLLGRLSGSSRIRSSETSQHQTPQPVESSMARPLRPTSGRPL